MDPSNILKYTPAWRAVGCLQSYPSSMWSINYYSTAKQLESFESLNLCVSHLHILRLLIMQIDFGVSHQSQRLLVRSNGDCQRSLYSKVAWPLPRESANFKFTSPPPCCSGLQLLTLLSTASSFESFELWIVHLAFFCNYNSILKFSADLMVKTCMLRCIF